MLGLVYFNWTGTQDEFAKARSLVKTILDKDASVDMVGVYVPSNEWNYAVLYKSDDFQAFLDFQKTVRHELEKAGLGKVSARKLELLIEPEKLWG